MTKGKSICNVLKTIRKQVADANEIKYEPRECHHEGECRGTCPACEAEVRYIEQQLNIRRQLGKAVAVAGISAGLAALSSCTSCSDNASNLEKGEMEQQSLMEGRASMDDSVEIVGQVTSEADVDTAVIVKDLPIRKKRADVDTAVIVKDLPIRKKRTARFVPPVPKTSSEADESSTFTLMGDVVEQMPSFPGGTQALSEYIEEHLSYPEEAEEMGLQGRVVITFVVDKDGSLTEPKVVKSVHPLLDTVAIRVVESMPKWNPGKQNGEAVRIQYTIPITFRWK